MWIGVRQRFGRFHEQLLITTEQTEDGLSKQLNVRKSLQRAYCGESTDTPPGFVVGSWGKDTVVRPPSDIDIFFVLPSEVYHRIEKYTGNKQSALIQEVKEKLLTTYPQTSMRGDGQVVIVGFNSIIIEVVPAFLYDGALGNYYMPDTNDGGSWVLVDPKAEIALIGDSDSISNGNTRRLARMLKVWKRECSVPLKSYQIEILAAEFMNGYANRIYDYYWYDWYFRDFFKFLCDKSNQIQIIPGTGKRVNLGDAWLSRAESARDRALKACAFEYDDKTIEAGEEWQKIFGVQIPIHVL